MQTQFYTQILDNVRKILRDRKLTQAIAAEYIETSPSQMSKILKGEVMLTIDHISKLASNLSMSEIDIITYPEVYVPITTSEIEPVEATLQIKLKKDKKDQVLKLVFGENNLEILNK